MTRKIIRTISVIMAVVMLFSATAVMGYAQISENTVQSVLLSLPELQEPQALLSTAPKDERKHFTASALMPDFSLNLRSSFVRPQEKTLEMLLSNENMNEDTTPSAALPHMLSTSTGSKAVNFSGTYKIANSGVTYRFTDNGTTLTLDGTGQPPKYFFSFQKAEFQNVHKIVVLQGVVLIEEIFQYYPNLETVYLAAGSIVPAYAFRECKKLRSINWENVTTIGAEAFYGCTSLTSASLSVAANIDERAFTNCTALTAVSAPCATSIGAGAFSGCTALTSVSLSSSLRTIGKEAFSICQSLRSISVPANVTSLGEGAFAVCTALQSVSLPSALQMVGTAAFYQCTSLTNVSMPSAKTWGSGVFYQCTSLTSFTMPDNLTQTGGYSFYGCDKLESVHLSVQLTGIGDSDFYGCHALTTITMPDCVTTIGEAAFCDCSALATVQFPDQYVTVGEVAFQLCPSLTAVNAPVKLKDVGDEAFYGTSLLTSVVFSPDTTYIGKRAFASSPTLTALDVNGATVSVMDYAFASCENLTLLTHPPILSYVGEGAFFQCQAITTVQLSADCTAIGDGAFVECPQLQSVDFNTAAVSIGSWAFCLDKALTVVTHLQNSSSIGDYAFSGCPLSGALTLPADLTALGVGAFGECTGITAVQLPQKLTVVPNYAFAGCTQLTTVTGGQTVETIGYGAFGECTALTAANFGAALTTVGDFVFYGCRKLTGIGSKTAVKEVGQSAFYDCASLTGIALSGVEKIGDAAFLGSGLRTITLLADNTVIGAFAFEDCVQLTAVTLSGKETVIGEEAFANDKALTTVRLTGQTASVGSKAFYGCAALTTVDLPDGVKQVGYAAFYQCTALSSVTLPDSIESIGYACFKECTSLHTLQLPAHMWYVEDGLCYGCTALTSVVLPEEAVEIAFAAFGGCTQLEEVTIGNHLTSIGDFAFCECSRLKNVALPDTLQSLGEAVFAYCDAITAVTLPRRVTVAGSYAFCLCRNLTSVKLSGAMVGVGIGAFYGCEKLKDVYFYQGVPLYIGDKAFNDVSTSLCLHYNGGTDGWSSPVWKGPDGNFYQTAAMEPDSSGTFGSLTWHYQAASGHLTINGSGAMPSFDSREQLPWYLFLDEITMVTLSSGITTLGDRAFDGAEMLRQVYLPDTVTAIGDYAFANCENLIYVRMPSGLKTIGNDAFYQCGSVRFDLPVGVERIGDYAFFGCLSMSDLVLTDSLLSLGEGAFYHCTGLQEVVLPSSLTEVKPYTFRGCVALERVILPETVQSVGRYAFGNCHALSVFVLMGNVAMGDYALAGCDRLQTISCYGEQPLTIGYDAFKGLPDTVTVRHILPWASEALTAADGRNLASIQQLPDIDAMSGGVRWSFDEAAGLLDIEGSGAMPDTVPWASVRDKVRTVIIGEGITTIGSQAFRDCTQLTAVRMSHTVTAVGEAAFAGCRSLKGIRLPESVARLGENAFYHCTSLAYIHVPSAVQQLPHHIFAGCESLLSVSLNGVTDIGYAAFYGCEQLERVVLSADSITTGDWSFARCGSLKEVTGSEQIAVLGKASFFGDESLSALTLSPRLTALPDEVFAGTGMTTVDLPSHIVSIGKGAFRGSALTSIDLQYIKTIGREAFFETDLTVVTIPAGVTSIGTMAFAACEQLSSVTVAAANTVYASHEGVLYSKNGDTLWQYPLGQSGGVLTVADTVRTIGEGAFYGGSFTAVNLPDTVTSIGKAAFAETKGFSYVILPAGLTVIDESVFGGNKDLKSVYVRSKVSSIAAYAFSGCEKLLAVYFDGAAPTVIGQAAFDGVDTSCQFYYGNCQTNWHNGTWQAPDGRQYAARHIDTDGFVYAVDLVLNGGTIVSGGVSRYAYGQGTVLPTNITKEGVSFAGWYVASDYSGSPVVQLSAGDRGDKVFYAKWSDSAENTVPVLTLADMTYNSAEGVQYMSVKVWSGQATDRAVLLAAAYRGGQLLSTVKQTLTLSPHTTAQYTVTATGALDEQTVFKFLLLSAEDYAPLTEHLTVYQAQSHGMGACQLAFDVHYSRMMPMAALPQANDTTPLQAVLLLSAEEMNHLLSSVERKTAGGINVRLQVTDGTTTIVQDFTSRTDTEQTDSRFGYQPSSLSAYTDDVPTAAPWQYLSYRAVQTVAKHRTLTCQTDGQASAVTEVLSEEPLPMAVFCYHDKEMLRLRSAGYYHVTQETVLQQTSDTQYTLVLPYYGGSAVVQLETQPLVEMIRTFAEAQGVTVASVTDDMTLAVVVGDADEAPYFRLHMTDSTTEILDFHGIGQAAQDTYEPLIEDESVDPHEEGFLTAEHLSPAKGGHGMVTVGITGTMMEADIHAVLVKDGVSLTAVKTYWFSHDKLYATFDLSEAPDGVYSLTLTQKQTAVTLADCFTVDGSLPQGQLKASVNVDKTAKAGKDYEGSVTFVNTGYTDVYAPVIYLDTANMQLKEQSEDMRTFAEKSVFVPNRDGLAGIVANGETAVYPFIYRITGNKGFKLDMYNYADIGGMLEKAVVLQEDSPSGDYLKANLQAIIGNRPAVLAENIAKMACQISALGDDMLDLAYLRNAYLSEAQGILTGSVLADAIDVSSRDLHIERYYSTNVVSRQQEGTFGKGWFSEWDVTATYQKKDGEEVITLQSPSRMAIYTKDDSAQGVFREAIYGENTASYADGRVTLTAKNGQKTFFNDKGRCYRMEDLYGNYIEAVYDTDGKLTEIKNSREDSLLFTYEDGQLKNIRSSIIDDEAQYTYVDGYLVGVMNSYGTVQYEYQMTNSGINRKALCRIKLMNGTEQMITYDDCGRVIALSNGEGTVSYAYTGCNTIQVTNAVGGVTQIQMNATGQVARAIDETGVVSEVAYSDYLLTKGISTGLFYRASLEYDDHHQVTKVTDADNSSVSYTYDDRGNMTSVTDKGGHTTVYAYNDRNETTRIIYPDGKFECFDYDSRGNVISETQRDGQVIQHQYDDLDQLIQTTYPTGETIRYAYNAAGQVIMIDENGEVTRCTYNGRGDMVRVEYPGGKRIDFEYNIDGSLNNMVANAFGFSNIKSNYDYNAYGRLENVGILDNYYNRYFYNPDGSLKKQTYSNGSYMEWTYEAGQLASIRNYLNEDTLMSSFDYTYNDLGQMIAVQEKNGTWTYGYDKAGQLTRATAPDGTETLYQYDYAGNRTAVVSGGKTVNYNSNDLNQYTVVGDTTRTYDDNGRLLTETNAGGTTTYDYDYQGRLEQVTSPDGTITLYHYDAFGMRSGVAVKKPKDADFTVTDYLNVPMGVGYTLVSHSDNTTDVYAVGNGLAYSWHIEERTSSSGEALEALQDMYYYSYNHLGSVTEITNLKQTMVNQYTYDQEGKVLKATEKVINPYQYVGRYGIMTDGNGLYYDRARYISASSMSFTSLDPIGQNGGLNLYCYAGNNPMNYIDVTGEIKGHWSDGIFVREDEQTLIDKAIWNIQDSHRKWSYSLSEMNMNLNRSVQNTVYNVSQWWGKVTEPSFAAKERIAYSMSKDYYQIAWRYGAIWYNRDTGALEPPRAEDPGFRHDYAKFTYREYVQRCYLIHIKKVKYFDSSLPQDSSTGFAASIALGEVYGDEDLEEFENSVAVRNQIYSGGFASNVLSISNLSNGNSAAVMPSANLTQGLQTYLNNYRQNAFDPNLLVSAVDNKIIITTPTQTDVFYNLLHSFGSGILNGLKWLFC